MAEMLAAIGRGGRLPVDGQTSKTAWLQKPNKPKKGIQNKRCINLTAPLHKPYLAALHRANREADTDNVPETERGAVAGRGTTHAIATALELQRRARKAKVNLASFYRDNTKAFDLVKRRTIFKQVKKTIGKHELRKGLEQRHRRMIYVTKTVDGHTADCAPEGVVQGDPPGPPLYCTGMRPYRNDVEQVQRRDPEIVAARAQLMATLTEIDAQGRERTTQHDLSAHLYVDNEMNSTQ